MRRSCSSVLLLWSAALVLLVARPASANTESCTQAHAEGQREQNAGHLKEALASFQACASDGDCPLPIRNECTNLYTTVEGRLPTMVFSIVDEDGNDVVDAKVWSGEALILSGLDGRPVPVNPGLHEFRFELASGQTLTKSVVVRQGEKDRIVSLQLPRSKFAGGVQSSGEGAGDTFPVERAKPSLKVPVASWVAYGVGVAALASWGTFALLGHGEDKTLDKCSPNCPSARHSDYDAMKRDYVIADVSLGVAAAAAVAGTVVLLTMGRKPKASEDARTARETKRVLSVAPVALGRVGWGLTLAGRY